MKNHARLRAEPITIITNIPQKPDIIKALDDVYKYDINKLVRDQL
jgi:hypothetical protein